MSSLEEILYDDVADNDGDDEIPDDLYYDDEQMATTNDDTVSKNDARNGMIDSRKYFYLKAKTLAELEEYLNSKNWKLTDDSLPASGFSNLFQSFGSSVIFVIDLIPILCGYGITSDLQKHPERTFGELKAVLSSPEHVEPVIGRSHENGVDITALSNNPSQPEGEITDELAREGAGGSNAPVDGRPGAEVKRPRRDSLGDASVSGHGDRSGPGPVRGPRGQPPGAVRYPPGPVGEVLGSTMGIDLKNLTYDEYLREYDRRCYSIAMERMLLSQQMGMGGMGGNPHTNMPMNVGQSMGMGATGGPRPFYGVGGQPMGMGVGIPAMMGPMAPGMILGARGDFRQQEWVGMRGPMGARRP